MIFVAGVTSFVDLLLPFIKRESLESELELDERDLTNKSVEMR